MAQFVQRWWKNPSMSRCRLPESPRTGCGDAGVDDEPGMEKNVPHLICGLEANRAVAVRQMRSAGFQAMAGSAERRRSMSLGQGRRIPRT